METNTLVSFMDKGLEIATGNRGIFDVWLHCVTRRLLDLDKGVKVREKG